MLPCFLVSSVARFESFLSVCWFSWWLEPLGWWIGACGCWVLLAGGLARAFGCLVSGLLLKRCFQVLLAAG